jgi:hypothetical protein
MEPGQLIPIVGKDSEAGRLISDYLKAGVRPTTAAPTMAQGAYSTLTHDEMVTIFERAWGRAGPPREAYQVYPSRQAFEDFAGPLFPERDPKALAGFFDSATNIIHVPPDAGTLSVFHEVFHWASRETNFSEFMGQFVDEGMTELLTQETFGPHWFKGPVYGYGQNIAFMKMFGDTVGTDVLVRAYMDGVWEPLLAKLDTILGNRVATDNFIALLRATPRAGGESLGQAMDMLWPGPSQVR